MKLTHLLLDENLSPVIADIAVKKCPNIKISSLCYWKGVLLRSQSDEVILRTATIEKLTLVTCDIKTIPMLLKQFAESGQPHCGVIFVPEKSIRNNQFAKIAEAICFLWKNHRQENWVDRIFFLKSLATASE